MRFSFTLANIKPFSVNSLYYGDGRTKTQAYHNWSHQFFHRLSHEDIQAGLVSKFGMVEALSLGLKIAKDKIEELILKDELQDLMWEIFCFIMGISLDDKEEDKVTNG